MIHLVIYLSQRKSGFSWSLNEISNPNHERPMRRIIGIIRMPVFAVTVMVQLLRHLQRRDFDYGVRIICYQ